MNDEQAALSPDAVETMSVHHLLLGSALFAKLFLSVLPQASARTILRSLLEAQLPSSFRPVKSMPNSYKFRWECSRLLDRFGGDIEYNPDLDVLMRISAAESQSRNVKALETMLEARKFSYSDQARLKLIQTFLAVFSECPALAEWLLPKLASEFQRAPVDKLYATFGSACFLLFPDHEAIELGDLRMEYKSDSDHETFWMVGEVYQCSRLAIHYQNGVCRAHRYPDVSLFSELFSLMHTSVLESVFFVDLVRDVARKCVEGGDFVGAYEKGGVLKEMNVWVFASLFPNLLDQFEDVAEKIMTVKVDKASICGELL